MLFFSPRLAAVISIVLDVIDGEFFKRADYTYPQYTFYDKLLDYYWYIWILAYLFVADIPHKFLFLFLFLYRTCGQMLYFKTHKRIFFLIFPNVFETLFFYYLLVVPVGAQTSLYFEYPFLLEALLFIIGFALIREGIIHVRKKGIFTGNASYWQTMTTNTTKLLILFSCAMIFVVSQFYLSMNKSIYKTQAERSNRDGRVTSYNETGSVSGYLNISTSATMTIRLFNSQAMVKPICQNEIKPLPIQNNKTYFLFRDNCLKNLPRGNYLLLLGINDTNNKSYLLEFTSEGAK